MNMIKEEQIAAARLKKALGIDPCVEVTIEGLALLAAGTLEAGQGRTPHERMADDMAQMSRVVICSGTETGRLRAMASLTCISKALARYMRAAHGGRP